MGRKTPTLIGLALILLAVGVAGANHRLSAVDGALMAQSSTPSTGTTTTTNATPSTPTTGGLAIEQIVSITRTVEAGATPVSAFTVPAGQRLVITDVLVTNPGTTPACGASVSPGGTATPATGSTTGGRTTTTGGRTTTGTTAAGTTGTTTTGTTPAGTTGTTTSATTLGNGAVTSGATAAAAGESGTGVLCVPAQTSMSLGLTTGLEFAAGQSVVLANTPPASTTTPPPASGPLHYHLRGFLMTPAAA